MRRTCMRALAAAAACAVALACALAAPAGRAFATGVPDTGRKGSITATVATDDALQSGRLAITHVASFSPEGGLALDETFAGSGVGLDGLSTASEWRQAAESLAAWADAHGVAATLAREAAGAGSIAFDGLDCGVYLVRGYDLASDTKTYDCGSTLICVPTLEGGSWVYDVDAELKVSVAEKDTEPEVPTEPGEPDDATPDAGRSGSGDLAGTGDHTSLVPVVVCVIAGCALVLLAVIRGRRK